MPARRRKEASVIRSLSARPVAAMLVIGMLGVAGCERSQPGPKPISGTATASSSAAAPALPAAPAPPGQSR
ncbi:hypothetical protein E0W60_06010 [Cupriavidus oxalaticus]|uniref:Uncharacterized protein n=1 Tax=Cupriavidus oxalaticus TaxID=96344 RepID=A0A4P7LFV8_9BURK|nr:hypothetical protein E0W60_06010 [Cupriavidus oxalaticus]TDF64308.1 hypothetical protein E1J61_18920 [Cupriavidus sp. L7L]